MLDTMAIILVTAMTRNYRAVPCCVAKYRSSVIHEGIIAGARGAAGLASPPAAAPLQRRPLQTRRRRKAERYMDACVIVRLKTGDMQAGAASSLPTDACPAPWTLLRK